MEIGTTQSTRDLAEKIEQVIFGQALTCANVNARLGEWRAVNANYYGDYYPLTPYAPGDDAWVGWQFDRPEVGAG